MLLGYLTLLGRIFLLGYERIIVKQFSRDADSVAATFWFFSLSALALAPLLFFVPLPTDWSFLYFPLVAGLLYAVGDGLYVRSLSIGEVSLVGPLYNFNVFFLLALSVVFLDEPFTALKLLGLVLLIYGASFLNRQKDLFTSLSALFSDPACRMMLISSFIVAIARTVDGLAVRNVDPVVYVFFNSIAVSSYLLVYLAFRGRLGVTLALFRTRPRQAVVVGAVNGYAYLLLLLAFTQLPVSVAEPASLLSMVVAVILAGRLLKEDIRQRLLGVGVMVVGAWLLLVQA